MVVAAEVLFASADTEEISHLHGECVQVHAAGGQCVLVNLCASQVTESACACSYFLSNEVQKTCQFWL